MTEYPTYITAKAIQALDNMSAHELYRVLCDGLSAEVMGNVDRALNAYVGQTAESDQADLFETCKQLSINWKSGLDLEQRKDLEATDYATEHDISEDEARRQLEEKAYWG